MAGHEGAEDGPLGVRVFTDGRCKTSEQGPLSYAVAVVTLVIYVRGSGNAVLLLFSLPLFSASIPASLLALRLRPHPCQVGWLHVLLGLLLASFFSRTALLILLLLFSTLLLPARPVLWGHFTKASSYPP